MQKIVYVIVVLSLCAFLCGCKEQSGKSSAPLAKLLDNYYEKRLAYFPLEATQNGDNRYNHVLHIDFTQGFRDTLQSFFQSYLDSIKQYNRKQLKYNDQLSYDIFVWEMETNLQALTFNDNLIPYQQFWGLPLTLAQLGSGDGNQPFNTIEDYDNWLQRAARFEAWADSAIVYFTKGINQGYVLPQALIKKMIPQAKAMMVTDARQSIFYGPVKKMPAAFPPAEKERLQVAFDYLVMKQLVPAYMRLADFLQHTYLPAGRTTSGLTALDDGDENYKFLIRQWTTTAMQPDAIYNTGLAEVKRIRGLMDSVKTAVGFAGTLEEFLEDLRSNPKFMPYRTPEEILNAFRTIQSKIEPYVDELFVGRPKTKFEIRQTEAYRAASASAEYQQGSADGSRPGIFYVPILDAKQYNITSGMESLFLHEAIPGHHYQVSLQQENEALPAFRRFSWYGAYGEGWALYCESLGKKLGLYNDPYQYMGALGDEMHRAIRLVVDVGLHAKDWTREQAIKYMMDNEAISEQGAIAEIERYMALPGQALSYKIGALKIEAMRLKYQEMLKDKFSLSSFHHQFLKDGAMPLEIVEKKMDKWASEN